MGYTTTFTGKFTCTPALNADQVAYLQALCNTRRMKRSGASQLPDPLREAVGLPLGNEDEYFVGGTDSGGQDPTIVDCNTPPASQPSLWCQWAPSDDGKFIEWDRGQKFHVQWIKYINENFLKPWGIKLSGDVKWRGEDSSDRGVIVAGKEVTALEGEAFVAYKQQKKLEREITTAIGKTTAARKLIKI